MLALVICTSATAAPAAEALQIHWSDLRQAAPRAQRAGPVGVEGQTVQLTGFLLPADREGDLVYSFLLLPEYGGCMHTPAPPADQIVLVTLRTPFAARKVYQVVSVSGVLQPTHEKTQLFVVDGVKVVESGYRIGQATVRASDEAVVAPQATTRNPWRRFGMPGGQAAPLARQAAPTR